VSALAAGGVGAGVSSLGMMRIEGRSTHSPDRQTMKWDASSSPATAGVTSRQVAMMAMTHATVALTRWGPMAAGYAPRQSLSKGAKRKWPRLAFGCGRGQ
jgi:hypothetical protein